MKKKKKKTYNLEVTSVPKVTLTWSSDVETSEMVYLGSDYKKKFQSID